MRRWQFLSLASSKASLPEGSVAALPGNGNQNPREGMQIAPWMHPRHAEQRARVADARAAEIGGRRRAGRPTNGGDELLSVMPEVGSPGCWGRRKSSKTRRAYRFLLRAVFLSSYPASRATPAAQQVASSGPSGTGKRRRPHFQRLSGLWRPGLGAVFSDMELIRGALSLMITEVLL